MNAVAWYFKENGEDAGIHLVYRLDRNTTGLVVVAKSANVQYDLSKSHDSVSYTHLDVYKRQLLIIALICLPLGGWLFAHKIRHYRPQATQQI